MKDNYINIKEIAKVKGLKSTRSLRLEINRTESKYISREVKVKGGTSYEILFSSLEPELQEKLRNAENKTTALVPQNYKESDFVSDKTKLTANYRANIVVALQKLRKKYPTKKEADTTFLDLYNSGLYLPKAYNFIGSISIGTLHRWVRVFEKHESTECLQPKYKWSKQGEYNSILNDEMKNILLTLLLHPSKYNYGKAIKLTKEILRKRGYEALPCDLSFKRFAENFRKNNYAEWVLRREGMKAYHDKVEPYIERDISKIEVGDILVADGHVLNFQVINPFTGKPTRATLVGFLDWKSTALVGYEIMMTESTQCIASALRNAIINLGMIPKVVYQFNETPLKQNGYKLQIFIISERKKRRKTQENEFVKVLYVEDLIYEIAELSIYKKQKIVEFLNESINFSISEAIIDETDFNIAKQPKNLKQFYKTLNFKFNSQEEDCNLKILNEYIKKLCNIDIKTRRYFCIFVKTMYKYKENKNIVKEYPHFKKYLKISTIEHNIKHVTKQELNEIMDYMQDQELVILDKNYETDEENKLISFKGCREWGDLVFDLMDFAIAKHIDAKDFFVNLDFSSLEDNK